MKSNRDVRLLFRRVSSVLLASALAAVLVIPAAANSAIRRWRGTTATGALLTDGQCPVQVEHESLTLTIREAPSPSYTPDVTAAYSLFNPTEADVEVTLAFPFGRQPYYYYDSPDDSDRYTVTLNDQPIGRTVRYTLRADYNDFNPNAELARLRDGYAEDVFFTPDMPVTVCTYRAEGVDGAAYPDAVAALDWAWAEDVRLLLPQHASTQTLSDGRVRLGISLRNLDNGSLTVYFVGGASGVIPAVRVYTDADMREGTELSVAVSLSMSETTFSALAREQIGHADGMSEIDRFNAYLDSLGAASGGTEAPGVFKTYRADADELLGWYEYRIVIPAGGRCVNKVTAPLYPDIDEYLEPPVYTFRYLLSPAAGWASFGTLDIRIDTPCFLLDSSLAGFERTETGYRLTRTGLPDSELTFGLSESENPRRAGCFSSLAVPQSVWLLLCTAALVCFTRRRVSDEG